MENAFNDFRERYALLLTELRRLKQEASDAGAAARRRELRRILAVVVRSYLREQIDAEVTEEQLATWLDQLEAA